jgi:copper chaperone CopZ
VAVTSTSPSGPPDPDPTSLGTPAAGLTTAELDVVGMHCGACVALIEESLTEQSGVAAASVDLESARAVVRYDPAQLGPDDLLAAIVEAGYSATPVS